MLDPHGHKHDANNMANIKHFIYLCNTTLPLHNTTTEVADLLLTIFCIPFFATAPEILTKKSFSYWHSAIEENAENSLELKASLNSSIPKLWKFYRPLTAFNIPCQNDPLSHLLYSKRNAHSCINT